MWLRCTHQSAKLPHQSGARWLPHQSGARLATPFVRVVSAQRSPSSVLPCIACSFGKSACVHVCVNTVERSAAAAWYSQQDCMTWCATCVTGYGLEDACRLDLCYAAGSQDAPNTFSVRRIHLALSKRGSNRSWMYEGCARFDAVK